MTKDDVLICRHDRYLSTTTNVADHAEFADRLLEREGRTDWWVEDFTLAEIRTLRSRQDYDYRSKAHDDKYAIPTFEETIALAKRKSTETGRIIGINPEPKQAAQFADMGKNIGAALVDADIYAILKIAKSGTSDGKKALWIAIVLVLPVLGVIIWYLLGPGRS